MRTAVGLLTLALLTPPPTTYGTFFVLQGASSGSTMVDEQLQGEIKMALADRARVETSPEIAEAVVVIHVATADKHSRDAFYEGWGGWGWRIDGPAIYKIGTVVVDIFDARTKRLLWDGSATEALTSHTATADRLRKEVAKLFSTFPPLDKGGLVPASTGTNQITDANEVPRIIFSSMPAVVVRIDGEPRYEPIPGTDLQRIVNTNTFIVRDDADMHYLKLGDYWMEAEGLLGGWSTAGMLPDGVNAALAAAMKDGRISPTTFTGDRQLMPIVFVATTPADLIITDGDPEFAHYNGTPLLYVKNTSAVVFKEPTDQELYVRLSGGWYRAWSTSGPWERIRDDALPADLAQVKGL
jgi:Domain of unknown function (DUF4136)